MHLISHLIEPSKLLITWQSADKEHRTCYIIGELTRTPDNHVSLTYLVNSTDFKNAKTYGFEPYAAFPNIHETHHQGVLEAFMRRLPPKSRADYGQYLEGFRIKADSTLSDFALLGYTGAKLPSDGFAIINPFDNINTPFDCLIEVAGYRYNQMDDVPMKHDITFKIGHYSETNELMIEIFLDDHRIGYITRALIEPFQQWINDKRIENAWIEKKNGTSLQPVIYFYLNIAKK
jgi:hypothetical protein